MDEDAALSSACLRSVVEVFGMCSPVVCTKINHFREAPYFCFKISITGKALAVIFVFKCGRMGRCVLNMHSKSTVAHLQFSFINTFYYCDHSNLSNDFLTVIELVGTVPDVVVVLKRGYIFMYVQ